MKQKITECKFHNKLLTVVEQHSIACFQGDAEIARPDNTRLDNAAQGSGVREQSSAGRLIAAE